jgi:hypothetical protein
MLTTHPLLVPRLRKSWAISPLTLWFLLGLLRGSLYLYLYQFVLNMAEALHYISNTVWTWKLHHNTNSRHVSPNTDSQTVQALKCTDMLGREPNSKFCLRSTALLVTCSSALWKVASVVTSEVFCVQVFCLSYFHHANVVFRTFWHLQLSVVK